MLMIDIHGLTLSDFLQMSIRRTPSRKYLKQLDSFGWEGEPPAEIAEIIFDYIDERPVRLMGFVADGSKSDFEIAEEGLAHWRVLYKQLSEK